MDMDKHRLAPSMLSADFKILGEQISELDKNGIDILHIDVMDGMFVPSISFGMPVIRSIRGITKLFFDVHLMVEEPVRYLEAFKDAGADGMTVHVEACKDVHGTLDKINELGCKPSIAINPDTPAEAVKPYLNQVYMVLVMTVHPGFGGQSLIEDALAKVEAVRSYREGSGLDFLIETDGGVNKDNISRIAGVGVDVIVAGTAVFEGNIKENIRCLKRGLGNAS